MADALDTYSKASVLFARDGGIHPPVSVLLGWPNANYIDPETRGWGAPIILFVGLGITFLVYSARIWARLAVAKNLGLDDVLMSIAMLFIFGLTISAVLAIRVYGFQWHAWDQTAATHITSREITISIELNYLASTTLIKISILCFYRRISGSLKTAFVHSVQAMIVFCAVYMIIFGCLLIFTCTPVIGTFHLFDIGWRLKNEVSCHDEGAIVVICAIIGTVQDFIICSLPVFLVWNLKMPRRTKIALCGIFGVGLVTCVCGILRTYYATYVYYFTYDITWYAYHGWIWTALEADLGVICASAPALKVFFKRYFSRSNTSYGGYSRSNRTPIPLSRSRGKNTSSGNSAMASRAEPSDMRGTIPMEGIKVSQGLEIHVEERDDISQKSFASTRNLTALPGSEEKTSSSWTHGPRTLCGSFTPGSRNSSRSRDPEHGRSGDDYRSNAF